MSRAALQVNVELRSARGDGGDGDDAATPGAGAPLSGGDGGTGRDGGGGAAKLGDLVLALDTGAARPRTCPIKVGARINFADVLEDVDLFDKVGWSQCNHSMRASRRRGPLRQGR